jgi:hypothetical protein
MTSPPGIAADDVDGLLEHYLGLLDEYTKLRSTLTGLQTSIYQSIARANFSAEHGIRYGQDMYDERMQRFRSLAIRHSEDGAPRFEVICHGAENHDAQAKENEDTDGTAEEKDKERIQKPGDPLKWFGILTPMALRHAQSQSIRAVEQIIPKLVSVDAAMADVEIRVRRARKKRAKAEAAAVKQRGLGQEKGAVEAGDENRPSVDGEKGQHLEDEKETRMESVTVEI